jgi:hypothetical protein
VAILSVTPLLFVIGGFRFRYSLFIVFVECFFEPTDRFPEPFSKFRKFFWTEDDKGNQENYQKVSRLKETLKHNLNLQSNTGPINLSHEKASTNIERTKGRSRRR